MTVKEITSAKLESFSKDFNSDRANIIAANASCENGLMAAATDYKGARKLPDTFSISLKQGHITNQKSSGRCWIFSALNTFRYELMQKNNIEDIELSQNYVFFYDKLEKANYFLESIMKIFDEPVDGRLYSYLNMMPLNDGGQWDMLVNLINKYGVCPKEAYPDSANSISSGSFTKYLTSKLREDAVILRKAHQSGKTVEQLREMKDEMLNEVYRILVIALGEPPVTFDWVIRDKDKKVIQEFGITPMEFYNKYIGLDLSNYISLINAPTDDKPFNRLFTVKFLGNVVEGQKITYLNLPIDIIKEAAIKQLKDGHPVWFGSDCSKYGVRKTGIWDRESEDIEKLLNIRFNFKKGDTLVYGDSAMNHAMVIMGVNLDKDGKPDRWRIENSWGKDSGRDGYYTCSDSWFEELVYQVVVNKKYLPDEIVKLLDQDYIELEPWDPMGTLAD